MKNQKNNDKRPSLDRSAVVHAALELLKKIGLDKLTTRALAAELGIKSPALYWHFKNKQELLDAMADILVTDAGMGPPLAGETWQEWLARRLHGYRKSLLAYPDSARIITEARQLGPTTIRIFNEELQAMVTLGFDPVQALRSITALTNYANGFILQEQGSRKPNPDPPLTLESISRLLSDQESMPLIDAFIQGGSPYSEESFDYGMWALINGFAVALERGKRKII